MKAVFLESNPHRLPLEVDPTPMGLIIDDEDELVASLDLVLDLAGSPRVARSQTPSKSAVLSPSKGAVEWRP